MTARTSPESTLRHEAALLHVTTGSSLAASDAAIEFGHSRVLLRRRKLLVHGVPVELGSRAFDLLLVLLEADGVLVTKQELLSRVWPGTVVSDDNLKAQIHALRKALGADRDVIHTEIGRGYRFTGVLRSNPAHDADPFSIRAKLTFNCRQPRQCHSHPSSFYFGA